MESYWKNAATVSFLFLAILSRRGLSSRRISTSGIGRALPEQGQCVANASARGVPLSVLGRFCLTRAPVDASSTPYVSWAPRDPPAALPCRLHHLCIYTVFAVHSIKCIQLMLLSPFSQVSLLFQLSVPDYYQYHSSPA